MTAHTPPLPSVWVWDVFCHVIDNHGDLGVCWRLSQALARLGHTVRLYLDHPEDLKWMAPHWAEPHGQPPSLHGVSVAPWPSDILDLPEERTPAQGVIEAFGCELPYSYLKHLGERLLQTTATSVVWINLDYMSAEAFYQSIHRLPSPQLSGPASGHIKWFYQPGFTPMSGGLLRPHPERRVSRALDLPPSIELANTSPNSTVSTVSTLSTPSPAPKSRPWVLFCYEPPALKDLLLQLSLFPTPVALQITPGRATRHALKTLEAMGADLPAQCLAGLASTDSMGSLNFGSLKLEFLPYMDQAKFDQLLSLSALNFVRGEDSLVQAIWAKRPFIWQIYPQDDGAHGPKLEAFLQTLQAPESLQRFMRVWNGLTQEALPELTPAVLEGWQVWSEDYALGMQNVPDLAQELVRFAQHIMAPSKPVD